MKTRPVVPAAVEFDDPAHPGVVTAPAFGDIYHPRDGAFEQARHVFLAGNGLPERWRGRPRFVVLETGFGLGNNFLATWAAWRDDPQRPARLVFVSIEKHPLNRSDLIRAHEGSPEPALAAALCQAWPPLTPDLHTLDLDGGQVRLLLALGDVGDWLPEIVASVDAFYLDGFAPARNPAMWDARLFRACARLAAPGATAATWSVARPVRDGLSAAGFQVQRLPGFGSKRAMTQARWAAAGERDPRHPPPPGRRAAPRCATAMVVGAGLAGAAVARALAQEGVAVTVLERRAQAASETSGNPAGLFHGVVHGHDGHHAQCLRAGSLRAAQLLAPLVASGRLPGQVQGLLRGTTGGDTLEAMQALLASQGLPASLVQALDPAEAAVLAGRPVAGAAWLHHPAGWVSPPTLVAAWLDQPGVQLRCDSPVHQLRRADPGADRDAAPDLTPDHGGWLALDAQGHVIARADVVVLANAHDAARLLAQPPAAAAWPLHRTRGQITQVPAALLNQHQAVAPRLPLASGGYLIDLPADLGGGLLCGATQQANDDDPTLRLADHQHNLAQVQALTGMPLSLTPAQVAALPGRVGWRLSADDRLPVLGPVPAVSQSGGRQLEQPRQILREPGLYVLTALGSRGLTLAPLLGEVLAAWITGAPVPVGASLLDALDSARFVSRALRQAASDQAHRR